MQELNKGSYRILLFVVAIVATIFVSIVFISRVTYGLQNSYDENNEFIGTRELHTLPPITNPPIQPTTTQPIEPTVNPTIIPSQPHTTKPVLPTESFPSIEIEPTTKSILTTESTLSLYPEKITSSEQLTNPAIEFDDNPVPEEKRDDENVPNNTTISNDSFGDNSIPNDNNPSNTMPKTGDEDTDPRPWLIIMAVSAFILRYIIISQKISLTEGEIENEQQN